jgi:hypothetical protein
MFSCPDIMINRTRKTINIDSDNICGFTIHEYSNSDSVKKPFPLKIFGGKGFFIGFSVRCPASESGIYSKVTP